jgi:hypothetical protein
MISLILCGSLKEDRANIHLPFEMPTNEEKKQKPFGALAPEDYYFNAQGLMVFTEKYHLKRGYCCESNCKHCPFSKQ